MDAPDLYGNEWFLLIRDRATQYTWVLPVADRKDISGVVDKFLSKVAKPYIKNKGHISRVDSIRTDMGTEFCNADFKQMVEDKNGVREHKASAAYVKDGRAERAIKHICHLTRTCLIEANLKKSFWSLIMDTVVHVVNRSWSFTAKDVPYRKLWGVTPSASYFRQPGCWAMVHIQDKHRRKLNKRSQLCIFTGYDTSMKCWVFLNPKDGRKIRTVHASFFERRRDPHEHVDISDMQLTNPEVVITDGTHTQKDFWKCQLWPTHRWPGRDFADISTPGEINEEWNPDDFAALPEEVNADEWNPDGSPFKAPLDREFDQNTYPQMQAEADAKVITKDDYEIDTSGFDPTFPSNVLRFIPGTKVNKKFLKDRLTALDGLRVRDALTMRFPNGKGVLMPYKRSDLRYDCGDGSGPKRLESIPTPENELDLAFIIKQVQNRKLSHCTDCTDRDCTIFGCRVIHHDEYQDNLETFAFDAEKTTWQSSESGSNATVTYGQISDDTTKIAVVKQNTTNGVLPVDGDASGEGWIQTFDFPQFPILLANGKTSATHEDHVPDGFMNVSIGSYACNMVIPTTDELLGYRGDGTYVSRDSYIHKSRHIQQVESDVHLAQLHAVSEGKDFVVNVPKGTKQAFNEAEFGPYWKTATYDELLGLFRMGCFSLEPLNSPEVRAVGTIPSHFVYTAKWTSDVPPTFHKFKARLVAGGNFERESDNPYENFSPTAGAITNRFFDAYCVYHGYHMRTTDMTQAFLNSDAKKAIFVRLPKGLEKGNTHCLRLLKMLYGLRSSPKAWMDTLSACLVNELGFQTCPEDPCLLRRIDDDGDEIVVEVYVDDCKWGSKSIPKLQMVIDQLSHFFKLTDDKTISTYLGLRYTQSVDKNGDAVLKVDQTAYIDTMVDRFQLGDEELYRSTSTPLPNVTGKTLEESLGNIRPEDTAWAAQHGYSVIIGSLIHAMVHTRPDIAYAVSILSRAMSNPEPYHWKGAQYVLRYLRHTRELGLQYRQGEMKKHAGSLLMAAVDSSFADCDSTARSTSGYVIWFGCSPLEWECKRQPLVTMSTMESEYVAASKCVNGIKALDKLLTWFRLKRENPTVVHEDNSACIAVAANPVHKSRTRHIAIRYHNVRDACTDKTVFLQQVWTGHQVADIFTKALHKTEFERFRGPLMGHITFDEMVQANPKPVIVQMSKYADVLHSMTNCGDYASSKNRNWPKHIIPLQPGELIATMMGVPTGRV
jgi:hypothetical protein